MLTLNWKVNPSEKQLYLWVPESIWFWKNYTAIPYKGHSSFLASGKTFKAKIKCVGFIGFETLEAFSAPVHNVVIKNIETDTGLTKGTSYRNHRELNADIGKFPFHQKNRAFLKQPLRIDKKSFPFKLKSSNYELDVLYSKFKPSEKINN
jgi:hypothetical protein